MRLNLKKVYEQIESDPKWEAKEHKPCTINGEAIPESLRISRKRFIIYKVEGVYHILAPAASRDHKVTVTENDDISIHEEGLTDMVLSKEDGTLFTVEKKLFEIAMCMDEIRINESDINADIILDGLDSSFDEISESQTVYNRLMLDLHVKYEMFRRLGLKLKERRAELKKMYSTARTRRDRIFIQEEACKINYQLQTCDVMVNYVKVDYKDIRKVREMIGIYSECWNDGNVVLPDYAWKYSEAYNTYRILKGILCPFKWVLTFAAPFLYPFLFFAMTNGDPVSGIAGMVGIFVLASFAAPLTAVYLGITCGITWLIFAGIEKLIQRDFAYKPGCKKRLINEGLNWKEGAMMVGAAMLGGVVAQRQVSRVPMVGKE